MGFIKNMTTGKDNQTHDVVRVAMTVTICALVGVMLVGSIVYIYGYLMTVQKPDLHIILFDIQTFFNANSTIAVAISAFLMSGASALFFKKTTEPDSSQTTIEKVSSDGTTPDVTRVTTVNNISTEAMSSAAPPTPGT